MNVFIVVYEDEAPADILAKAEALYGNGVLPLSDRVLLVRAYLDDPAGLSTALEVSGETDSSKVGVVFKLNGSYAGNHYRNVWDWLAEARGQAVG